MAKADNHLSMESVSIFFLWEGEGMLSCLPSKEIDTLGRSLSKRVEFSGSSESNSMYSPRRMACSVLRGMWADRVACDGDKVETLKMKFPVGVEGLQRSSGT